MASFRPLIAVAMGEIREALPPAKFEKNGDAIEKCLSQFIYDGRPFGEVQREFAELVGSVDVLVKVDKILKVDDTPLPPALETFVSNATRNHITSRKKARPWTDQEDIRLLAAIHKFGLESWGEVMNFVGSGRSRTQCSQRWFRGLDPRISKVLWSPEEDEKLVGLVARHGDHSWTRIANELGNRCDAQCRYRYSHLMKMAESPHREAPVRVDYGAGVKEVSSVPASVMGRQMLVSVTKSMMSIPQKRRLPPITDLLKQNGVAGDQVGCPPLPGRHIC